MARDEKEVKLAEGLAQKLAAIEDPSKTVTSTADQTVVSPFDEEKDKELAGFIVTKAKLADLSKPEIIKTPEPIEPVVVENIKYPDPVAHKYISFVKSGFRIAAGFALALGYLQGAGLLLVLAEVLGIAEEMV
jgi:hypothetical protein